jgi:hypothetical protein
MRLSGNRASLWPDGVRASDAERDQAISELRNRFAEGRLSQDSFLHRMDAALRCRERSELSVLLADMPAPQRAAGAAASALSRAASAARRCAAAFQPAGPAGPAELVLPRQHQGPLTIGRDAGCDLVLENVTVSRRHAELHRGVSCWLLSDLDSTNGTRLNGWRVRSPVAVRTGDKVSFGAMTFVLCDRD